MQTEPNAKQQIVERIKNSTNILVTVGANPSVDELSAALGLSLILNKMDKHATAVFSGATPPAITFLEPEKTFENTVDSLRDFIIALDKSKADRLRYKVEDEVVRIFITPYKSVLSEKDLKFSQGDFNVELILALGVEKREDLDTAITAHGRILHDATVVTVNMNGAQSSLGALDWTDSSASSLCEMLMSLSEALQPGVLDEQIATALLTGIVAATDRFRNEHTTPKVMTMSAQLMAAGANQQLIAEKLEQGDGLDTAKNPDGSTTLPEGDASEKIADKPQQKPDGELEIHHDDEAKEPAPTEQPADDAVQEAENELAETLPENTQQPNVSTDTLQQDLEQASIEAAKSSDTMPPVVPSEAAAPQIIHEHRTWQTDNSSPEPSFGGTLNATASDAEEDNRREEDSNVNRQILSHDAPPADVAPMVTPDAPAPEPQPDQQNSPVLTQVNEQEPLEQAHTDGDLNYEPAPVGGPAGPTLSQLDEQTRGKATDDARAAVDAVLNSMPFDPANQPMASAGAQPAVEVQHSQTFDGPVAPVQDVTAPVEAPAMFANPTEPVVQPTGLPTPPPLPPLPDFSTLPPLSNDQPEQPTAPLAPVAEPAPGPVNPSDPGQFRIPGQ